MEYAKQRVFADKKVSKKRTALLVGYTLPVAKTVMSKIESKPGYKNAVSELAKRSNTTALDIMDEFKRRGVQDFSNKELISGLSAITNAWSKFNAAPKPHNDRNPEYDNGKNRLRTIVLQNVKNQTIQVPAPIPVQAQVIQAETIPVEEDPGF